MVAMVVAVVAAVVVVAVVMVVVVVAGGAARFADVSLSTTCARALALLNRRWNEC